MRVAAKDFSLALLLGVHRRSGSRSWSASNFKKWCIACLRSPHVFEILIETEGIPPASSCWYLSDATSVLLIILLNFFDYFSSLKNLNHHFPLFVTIPTQHLVAIWNSLDKVMPTSTHRSQHFGASGYPLGIYLRAHTLKNTLQHFTAYTTLLDSSISPEHVQGYTKSPTIRWLHWLPRLSGFLEREQNDLGRLEDRDRRTSILIGLGVWRHWSDECGCRGRKLVGTVLGYKEYLANNIYADHRNGIALFAMSSRTDQSSHAIPSLHGTTRCLQLKKNTPLNTCEQKHKRSCFHTSILADDTDKKAEHTSTTSQQDLSKAKRFIPLNNHTYSTYMKRQTISTPPIPRNFPKSVAW